MRQHQNKTIHTHYLLLSDFFTNTCLALLKFPAASSLLLAGNLSFLKCNKSPISQH